MGSRDVWFGANGFLAYTTNKQTTHYCHFTYTEVGWMFKMATVATVSTFYRVIRGYQGHVVLVLHVLLQPAKRLTSGGG